MADHPLQGLMRATLENLRDMIDVNTVIGDPLETGDGKVIVPVSRVTMGFVAGGSEFGHGAGGGEQDPDGAGGGQDSLPFGGGSGAAVSVQPVGFLIVAQDSIRVLPVEGRSGWDRLIEVAPQVLERVGLERAGQRRGPGGEPGDRSGGAGGGRPEVRAGDSRTGEGPAGEDRAAAVRTASRGEPAADRAGIRRRPRLPRLARHVAEVLGGTAERSGFR